MCVCVCDMLCVCVCVYTEKKLSRDNKLKRQDTTTSLDHTTKALQRFQSTSTPFDEDEGEEGKYSDVCIMMSLRVI